MKTFYLSMWLLTSAYLFYLGVNVKHCICLRGFPGVFITAHLVLSVGLFIYNLVELENNQK